jgi:hypothetical protein
MRKPTLPLDGARPILAVAFRWSRLGLGCLSLRDTILHMSRARSGVGKPLIVGKNERRGVRS